MPTLADSVESEFYPWAIQHRIQLADARHALNALTMPKPGTSYIDYRSGVMAHGDTGGAGPLSHMALRARATTGMAVAVDPGSCVINTTGLGAYLCVLDAVATLDIAASSPTTNRIDLIIARVYDDMNAAIASPADERKLVIEVWQGDGSTGTPVQPVPTPTAGWIPLAAIRVNMGVSSITSADVTDLRGPGLVTRGGLRPLYGTNTKTTDPAFTEAGAYPGDQRFVLAPGFQHQVYFGGTLGWRGMSNMLRYVAAANPNEPDFFSGGIGVRAEILRVTVPDPGMPYCVYPTATCHLVISADSAIALRIELVDGSNTLITQDRIHTYGAGNAEHYVGAVPPKMHGPLTGASTVRLIAEIRATPSEGSGFTAQYSSTDDLNVVVVPSHVQPPVVP